MSKARRLAIMVLLSVLVVTGLWYPKPETTEAAQATCANPDIAFNRQRWCGYFRNRGWDNGDFVRSAGMAGNNTVGGFMNMIEGDLNSGNAQRVTGAQFLILTMLGYDGGVAKSVSPGQLQDWKERVKSFGDISENGTTSIGSNGKIDWYVWDQIPCTHYKNYGSGQGWYGVNTYYQYGGRDDIAPYLVACGSGTWEEFTLIRDRDGTVLYRIRRECLNPIGQIGELPKPQDEYDLTPSITLTVNGAPLQDGVEVGQTLQFTYTVRNSGPDASPPNTNCSINTNVHAGFAKARANPTPGGGAGPPTGCPRSLSANNVTQLGSVESVLISAGGQTICRSLFVSPATADIASRGTEVCVPVVNKPYFKVYGGDLSAGAGEEPACVADNGAAVIGWNRGSSGSYGGAGVQFAIYALSQIYETATAVGNSGANLASVPSGLAFAVNASPGSVYGGQFGVLPCITDYYATKPASPMQFNSLNAANTSGAYEWDRPGQLNLSGQVDAGKRITVYVKGNVVINNDITYPGGWDAGTMPLFQLIVKGNIYIRNTVNTIEGIFIAQQDGASGGTIYTCTAGASAPALNGSLHNLCNRKLTINGAFVAHNVQFLRTNGTKHLASGGNEAGSSGNIAEVFNFSPALWMAQPLGPATGSGHYDSITALPPIL